MNTCIKVKNKQYTLRDDDINDYVRVNEKLNEWLIEWKNKINDNKVWDTAKRLYNTYEFIFSSGYNKESVSKKKPLSRSYFKLWEILHDFDIIQEGSKTAHIAEGPGGFIECICDLVKKYEKKSTIYGITLISSNKKIPSWKLSKSILDKNDVHLYNQDNGNIYNIQTINNFIDYVGEHSCDFVTSDGGFDFSADFNNQEADSLALMISEIYITLRMQKQKGSMLIKVFDLFSLRTIKLISLCSNFYEEFVIIKPQTSRPANSEKYLLFTNYFNFSTQQQNNLNLLKQCIVDKNSSLLDNYTPFENTLIAITKYNLYYTAIQADALKETLELSNNIDNHKKNNIINRNINLCRTWCSTYDIATH